VGLVVRRCVEGFLVEAEVECFIEVLGLVVQGSAWHDVFASQGVSSRWRVCLVCGVAGAPSSWRVLRA
jgi:hypothetical protein